MTSKIKLPLSALMIWMVCALYSTYEFLIRTILGTFEAPILHDLHLSYVSFAFLSTTIYQVTYGLMQLPVAAILSQFGLKRTTLFGALIASLSILLFSYTHSYNSALLFRFSMSFGTSFAFVCLLIAVYEWIPPARIGTFVGWSQFISTIGPMLAAGPIDSLADHMQHSWRSIFLLLGLFGLGISWLIYRFVENNTQNPYRFDKTSVKTQEDNLWALLQRPQVWLIAFFSGTTYFAIEYLSENSGKAYLMLNGLNHLSASYVVTFAWFIYAISCPLLGYISDRTQMRKPVMIVSAAANLLAILGILYAPMGPIALCCYFALLGFGASGQNIGFIIMAEHCSKRQLAAGLAINNAALSFFSAINAPLIGLLLNHSARHHSLQPHDYQQAFSVMLILITIGFGCAIFGIKETHCSNQMASMPV